MSFGRVYPCLSRHISRFSSVAGCAASRINKNAPFHTSYCSRSLNTSSFLKSGTALTPLGIGVNPKTCGLHTTSISAKEKKYELTQQDREDFADVIENFEHLDEDEAELILEKIAEKRKIDELIQHHNPYSDRERAKLQKVQDDLSERIHIAYKRLGWRIPKEGETLDEFYPELGREYSETIDMIGESNEDDSELIAETIEQIPSSSKKDPVIEMMLTQNFKRVIIFVGSVKHMTKLGSVKSIVAIVAVGNEDGVAGFATAKGSALPKTLEVATKRAFRRILPIPRYQKHTIWHGLRSKYKGTKLIMRPRKQGTGIVAHRTLASLCKLMGITDISINLHGTHNPLNLTRALFHGLLKQRDIETVAKVRGVNMRPLRENIRIL